MSEYVQELETERSMKDRFMAHHVESPFVQETVLGFHGLRYFPIDVKFRVKGRLERREIPEEAHLRTNKDGQAVMRYLGDLVFSVGARPLRLKVYHAGEGVGTSVFVPFRDSTSGGDSYGPGRYVTFELNETDEYEIDFNQAFNPYCAYTDAFECPFPPAENDLPVAIRAGEKVWSTDHNPSTPNTAVMELLPGGGKKVKKAAAPTPASSRVVPPKKTSRPASKGPKAAGKKSAARR
jgi:uncharacterized protein (DUF1684 family)